MSMKKMSRGGVRRWPLAALALALGMCFASSASADTIGAAGGDTPCYGSFVLGSANYQVLPSAGGTITSFAVQTTATASGQQLDFLVLRPAGSSYTVVGRTGLVTLAGTGIERFPANISVRQGDIIGQFLSNGNGFNCLRNGVTSRDLEKSQSDDPKVGDTVTFDNSSGRYDLNESATLVPRGLSLTCEPGSVHVGQATTCVATYSGSTHPTGTVTFATNASGRFSAPTCTLVQLGGNQARCSVTYTPSAVPPTTHKIYANYSGDSINQPAHTSTTVNVTP